MALALLVIGAMAAGCGERTAADDDWHPTWSDACPLWSADGAMLAFDRTTIRDDDARGIYVQEQRSGELRQIARGDLWLLGWSGDGGSLVVARSWERPHPPWPRVLLLDRRSGRLSPLFNFAASTLARERKISPVAIRPSPDLSRFLVTLQLPSETADPTDYHDEAWVVSAADGAARLLPGVTDHFAVWSPEGRWIAHSDLDSLRLISPDGRHGRFVAGGSPRSSVHSPVFSPDGRRLAYADREEVWVANLGTGGRRQVAGAGGEPLSWSPDGERLLVSSGGGLQVVRVADGGLVGRLPEWRGVWPGTGIDCPAFSPVADKVAFLRTFPAGFGGHDGAVYVAPGDLGTPERVSR